VAQLRRVCEEIKRVTRPQVAQRSSKYRGVSRSAITTERWLSRIGTFRGGTHVFLGRNFATEVRGRAVQSAAA